MATCGYCGAPVEFPHTCSYCNRPHCGDCRLPENHDCTGAAVLNADAVAAPDGGRVMSTRRGFLYALGAAVFAGIGYVSAGGEVPESADSVAGPVRGALGNVSGDLETGPSGKRRFNLGAGGYKYAEWTDSGALEIGFKDDPPMHEWYLVGPEPERKVLAGGRPPTFGGTRTAELSYPVAPGEYLLTGAELDIDPDNILQSGAERTGTARFTVTPRVSLESINRHGDGSGRAELTIRNNGSCPYHIAGARFSEAVPGTGTRKYEFFDGGKQLLLPKEERTVTTGSYPFLVPNDGGVEMPEEYVVAVWAHGEPWAFRVNGDSVERLGSVPDALAA